MLDGTEKMTSLGPRTYNHFVTCSGTAEGPGGAIIKGSLLATEVQGLVYGRRGGGSCLGIDMVVERLTDFWLVVGSL